MVNKHLLNALVLGLLTVGWALATTVAGAPSPGIARRVPQAPGDLDPSFGRGGIVTATYGLYSSADGLTAQPDGRLVLIGASSLPGSVDWLITRSTSTGAPDPTFDGDGVVTTDFNGGFDSARAGLVQSDGRILVVGSAALNASNPVTPTLALARYLPNGTLDPTFGTGGKVTTRVGPNSRDASYDVALTADNKIVTVGWTSTGGQAVWLLARYLPDGTLDPTFGTGGLVQLGSIESMV